MRHDKMPRARPRPVTSRRVKASERALQRERDKHPLFADQVASEQPTPEERIRQHEDEQMRHWQSIRDHAAKTWREARRLLFSFPEEQRKELLDRWNNGPLPGSAAYFADFIHRHTGQSPSRDR